MAVVTPDPHHATAPEAELPVDDAPAGDKLELLRQGQTRLLELIASGRPLTTTLAELALLIESQSKGLLCSVLLLDDDGVHIRMGAAPSLPHEYMAALDGYAIGPEVGSCGTAMYTGKPVIVSDIMTDPLWAPYKELASPHGLRACWSTPIFLPGGKVLGSFAMYYKEVRSPTETESHLMKVATHMAGIAIERNRREAELQNLNAELEERVARRTEELQLAQQKLVENAKLAALGSLVAGVAHEVNTPLGIALLSTTYLQDELKQLRLKAEQGKLTSSSLYKMLDKSDETTALLNKQIVRASDLIVRFKQTTSTYSLEDKRQCKLAELIQTIVASMASESARHNVEFHLQCADDLSLNTYPHAIVQILTNLISNSLYHGFIDRPSGNIYITCAAQDAEHLKLSFANDGNCIDDDVINKVFEPFYTSQRSRGFTGLGLSIIHNLIVQLLGGDITLRNLQPHGVEFEIIIPLNFEDEAART